MAELKERRIVTPLNSTFMLTSILGFLITVFYIPYMFDPVTQPKLYSGTIDFAFAFGLVFLLMFIASLISMNASLDVAPTKSEHLQIDEKRRIKIRF